MTDHYYTIINQLQPYEVDRFLKPSRKIWKGFNWCRKLMYKILDFLKTFDNRFSHNTIEFKRYEIDNKKLIDLIIEQNRIIIHFWNTKPKTVYVGNDVFKELTGVYANAPYAYAINLNRTPQQLLQMNIKIIPWMKGFLIV